LGGLRKAGGEEEKSVRAVVPLLANLALTRISWKAYDEILKVKSDLLYPEKSQGRSPSRRTSKVDSKTGGTSVTAGSCRDGKKVCHLGISRLLSQIQTAAFSEALQQRPENGRKPVQREKDGGELKVNVMAGRPSDYIEQARRTRKGDLNCWKLLKAPLLSFFAKVLLN